MSNDTREALAAKIRSYIPDVIEASNSGDLRYARLTVADAQEILAALTEQPAAPRDEWSSVRSEIRSAHGAAPQGVQAGPEWYVSDRLGDFVPACTIDHNRHRTDDWRALYAAAPAAPAVQPEAVAELVDALEDVLAAVGMTNRPPATVVQAEAWLDAVRRVGEKARALIAKHGQPQGSQ